MNTTQKKQISFADIETDKAGVPKMLSVHRMTEPCPEPGIYKDIPADEYHEIDAFNASTGKEFVKSGLHGAAYLEGESSPPTNAMLLGTACHSRVFEPDDYNKRAFTPMTKPSKATKAKPNPEEGFVPKPSLADGCVWKTHKKAQDEHPDKIILHAGWAERIENIHDAVMRHPAASELLLDPTSDRELTVIWHMNIEIGGKKLKIPCKARFDMFNHSIQCIPDLKVTDKVSPEKFEYKLRDIGWHMSGGFYVHAALAAGLLKRDDMGRIPHAPYPIIAVESTPVAVGSKIHIATIHAPPIEHLEQGFSDLIEMGMKRYLKYRMFGEAEPPAWMNCINPIGLPIRDLRDPDTFGNEIKYPIGANL